MIPEELDNELNILLASRKLKKKDVVGQAVIEWLERNR